MFVKVVGVAVNREHARGFTNTQDFLTCKHPMDITGQRGQVTDVFDMRLLVQDRLIKMSNAPTLRYVELKEFSKFLCGFTGSGVAPCAEWDKLVPIFIKSHIPVHHGTEANGADGLKLHVKFFCDFVTQVAIAFLQTLPNSIQTVCPDAILVLVLPFMAAGRQRCMVFTDQHRLDACRAKLDAKGSLSIFNCFLDIVLLHVPLP